MCGQISGMSRHCVVCSVRKLRGLCNLGGGASLRFDLMSDPTNPAAAPPVIESEKWDRFEGFRETFLAWFTGPRHNATLRGLGTRATR